MVDVAVVISAPGAADSKHTFRDLTPLWPDSVTPLFHNLAGLSGEPRRSGYSWQDEVDRLAARINVLTDDRVYLLGLSAGASLALAYIAQHPRQIAGIGLIEPAWSFLPLSEKERHRHRWPKQPHVGGASGADQCGPPTNDRRRVSRKASPRRAAPRRGSPPQSRSADRLALVLTGPGRETRGQVCRREIRGCYPGHQWQKFSRRARTTTGSAQTRSQTEASTPPS